MIYEFFSSSSNIPRGLSAYKPYKFEGYCLKRNQLELIIKLLNRNTILNKSVRVFSLGYFLIIYKTQCRMLSL